MIKKSLLFGAIASIIAINSVFADTTVTSKTYVDNHDALKQDKITAGTTGNVVTYNGTQNGQAQFSERAIFDPETNFDYENNEVASGHEGDLVTADSIFPTVNDLRHGPANTVAMYNGWGFLGGPGGSRGIYDGSTTYDSSTDADKLVTASVVQNVSNNLPETTVTYKTCTEWLDGAAHTDQNCILWNLSDKNVYGKCHNNNDCAWLDCTNNPDGRYPSCSTSIGRCLCGGGR